MLSGSGWKFLGSWKTSRLAPAMRAGTWPGGSSGSLVPGSGGGGGWLKGGLDIADVSNRPALMMLCGGKWTIRLGIVSGLVGDELRLLRLLRVEANVAQLDRQRQQIVWTEKLEAERHQLALSVPTRCATILCGRRRGDCPGRGNASTCGLPSPPPACQRPAVSGGVARVAARTAGRSAWSAGRSAWSARGSARPARGAARPARGTAAGRAGPAGGTAA